MYPLRLIFVFRQFLSHLTKEPVMHRTQMVLSPMSSTQDVAASELTKLLINWMSLAAKVEELLVLQVKQMVVWTLSIRPAQPHVEDPVMLVAEIELCSPAKAATAYDALNRDISRPTSFLQVDFRAQPFFIYVDGYGRKFDSGWDLHRVAQKITEELIGTAST